MDGIETKTKSDFLFSTPTFLSGFGSVMNLFGSYYGYNTSENGEQADKKALEADMHTIAYDFDDVIKKIADE